MQPNFKKNIENVFQIIKSCPVKHFFINTNVLKDLHEQRAMSSSPGSRRSSSRTYRQGSGASKSEGIHSAGSTPPSRGGTCIQETPLSTT